MFPKKNAKLISRTRDTPNLIGKCSSVRGDQHGRSPFLAREVAASASSARQAFGQSAFASRPIGSAIGADVPSEAGPMSRLASTVVETQRDVEGLELPSRITSLARRARFAFKCCTRRSG